MSMHLLELKDICVAYDAVYALRNCTFHVDKNDMVSIVGSNGAGKTTMCKTISGLLQPKAGQIVFDGADITRMPSYERVELGIIHCPEGRHIFPTMSILENLQLGAYCKRGRGHKEKSLNYVFQLFPILAQRKSQLARTLSGGEQQMLAIGRSLMAIPQLLILDEPSLGLSPINVQLIFEKLAEIMKEGTTVLLVEQNVEKALQSSNRGYALENGEVVLSGTGKELLANEDLKRIYLGM